MGTFVRLSISSFVPSFVCASPDLRPERTDFRPERTDSRPKRANFRPDRADFRPDRAYFRPDRADFRPERTLGGQTDEWTDGRTDGWMNGWTDEQKFCVLQDFAPFRAAALLPLTPIHNHVKQGNGYH